MEGSLTYLLLLCCSEITYVNLHHQFMSMYFYKSTTLYYYSFTYYFVYYHFMSMSAMSCFLFDDMLSGPTPQGHILQENKTCGTLPRS